MREPNPQAGFGRGCETACAPRKKSATAANLARRHRALQEELDGLKREHDELRRTMFEGAQVQRMLCGPRHLRRESFEMATEIFPVRHVSGDFISTFEAGDDLVFAIGDIAGKGLAAAMWVPHLLGLLRLHAGGDPAATMSAVNRDLCQTGLNPPLTTLFLARVNVGSGKLTYCNAGHPPSLLLGRDGQAEMLAQGGPLLGAVVGAGFRNGESILNPGDTLWGYSDGVLECRNPEGQEFGIEGVAAAARQLPHAPPSAALFSVLAAAEDFAREHPREDDMAMVVVRRS